MVSATCNPTSRFYWAIGQLRYGPQYPGSMLSIRSFNSRTSAIFPLLRQKGKSLPMLSLWQISSPWRVRGESEELFISLSVKNDRRILNQPFSPCRRCKIILLEFYGQSCSESLIPSVSSGNSRRPHRLWAAGIWEIRLAFQLLESLLHHR